MCLFIINKKEKEIQKKRNIKSRKIDKRKRKRLVLTCIITNSRQSTPVDIGVELDIETYRFLSYVTRLARMLLMLCFKIY